MSTKKPRCICDAAVVVVVVTAAEAVIQAEQTV